MAGIKPQSSTKGKKSPDSTKSKAAAPSSTGSKKRVRVVEPANSSDVDAVGGGEEDDEEEEEELKEKKKKGKKVAEAVKLDTARKDLKKKAPGTIPPIVSAEAPEPGKGALKKETVGKKAGKAAAVEEDAEEEEDDEEEEEEEEEEIDFLKGFEESDDGEDSSDEEDGQEDAPFHLEALPTVSAEEAGVQKKLQEKAERKKNAKTGTIYLGRIPHGFHEEEMKSYFSQFGEITRLRLSRNKTTGASKHYAFIEFAYASVAQIVQETMDNYLLAGHILVCKIVPDDEIHPKMWIGANRKFRPVPKGRKDRVRRDAPKSDEKKANINKRLLKREAEKRSKLEKLGIEYDFSGYAGKDIVNGSVEAKQDESSTAVKRAKKGTKSSEPAKKKARKSA